MASDGGDRCGKPSHREINTSSFIYIMYRHPVSHPTLQPIWVLQFSGEAWMFLWLSISSQDSHFQCPAKYRAQPVHWLTVTWTSPQAYWDNTTYKMCAFIQKITEIVWQCVLLNTIIFTSCFQLVYFSIFIFSWTGRNIVFF